MIIQCETLEIPRVERAIFDLISNIDELCDLKPEFSIQDMNQIEEELERLRSTIRRKRALARWVFPCVV